MSGSRAAARAWRSALGQRLVAGDRRPERLRPPVIGDEPLGACRMISSEFASHASEVSPQAVIPWPPRIAADRLGMPAPDARRCRGPAGTRAGARRPRRRGRRNSARGQGLAVGRGRQRDARIGVEVVDVRRRRPGRASPCRSTGRRRRARAGSSRTRRPSRPRARRPGRRRRATRRRSSRRTASPASVSVPRSPPDPLTHSSSTGRAGDRIDPGALGRRVAAGVVRVPRVGAEPVRALDERATGELVPGRTASTSCAPAGLLATDPVGLDGGRVARPGVGADRIGIETQSARGRRARSGRTSVS